MVRWTGIVLVLAVGLTLAAVAQSATYHVGREGDETVTTTAGAKIDISYEPKKAFYAFRTLRDGRHVALEDGAYSLTNGGAIKVQGGRVVWDAFGVIDELNRGIFAHTGNDKG